MPVTTTAVIAEYLAIGATAWLWVLPLLGGVRQNLFQDGATPGPFAVLVIVLATYLLGVVTEALSWGVERLAVGRASAPRGWHGRVFKQNPTPDEWLAAQQTIWSSEQAQRDFTTARQRILLSRGMALNGIAAVPAALIAGHGFLGFLSPLQLSSIAAAVAVLGGLAWLLATYEYHAKVQVAGRLEKKQTGDPREAA